MNPEKIAIITDSCADLQPHHIGDDPIFVIPLVVRCNEKEYLDGVDITPEEVFSEAKLRLPQTSLPRPGMYYETLNRIKEQGFEKVIAIMVSSGLSGTYNMMRLAGEDFEGLEVRTYDSLSGALPLGMMVRTTMDYINKGATWEQLKYIVPRLIRNTFGYFSLDTLEYLEKGGRIGKVTAKAGAMLNLKPILTFTSGGELTSVARARGSRQAQAKLKELVHKLQNGHSNYVLMAAKSGDPDGYEAYIENLKSEFPDRSNYFESVIDCTLSVYVGPGLMGAGIQILDDVDPR